ncbi:hypothetical protein [Mucilaginibacter gotjawali]|uniref:Uncharacterized protein n=2 Tax=Mucilaginibacter gotjawali TaxID=1550579 RepID=A0A839SIN2_9SPHI|nr:hypothetical protein [Mucilaginibacter gotjawali]MBB3057262.1 hypothetical protein [Mucilaginibacter gotjawali]BAU52970.1 hypothetical protein MgSA37_01137 [Mucilaginibacter gotjawali]
MTKKYTLKPGKHQFASGSPAIHDNDNLSDEEAEWYLEKYPHIAGLFVERLESCKVEMLENVSSENIKKETETTPSEADQQEYQPEK